MFNTSSTNYYNRQTGPGTRAAIVLTLLLTLLLIFIANSARSQGSSDYGKGLKVNFDEVDSKFIRFVLWNQFWTGLIENNPGTIVNGEATGTTWNYGARRIRVLAHTQISPRYLIVIHFGINNQTFASGGGSGTAGTGGYGAGKKPQLFFHDAYNEYAIIPRLDPETNEEKDFNLYAGAGLHYWNGISRLSSGSTLNMLMVDAPVFNWPTVDISDQFGRQFGLYVKGAFKKFHYQFHLNKPFVTSGTPAEGLNIATDNNGDPNPAWGGYIDYQLLDKESQVLPFRVGTYVGTKKILNIGAGFYRNSDATKSSSALGRINTHDINLFGLDVFADLPVGSREKNMALTFYGVYYNFNFGPNYFRTTGICNPGVLDVSKLETERALEGAGNSRILLGTGEILYAQAGFLLPKTISGKVRIQPMAAIAQKNLQFLREIGTFYDIGTNIYLDGHHSKITLQYSSRPIYNPTDKLVTDYKGEFLVQFQVYL